MLGVVVEKPIKLQGPERTLAHDPLDAGVGPPFQQLAPHQLGQEPGVEGQQTFQVLAVFLADVLPHLGVPTPACFEMLQGY